jgi:hypothetical protein
MLAVAAERAVATLLLVWPGWQGTLQVRQAQKQQWHVVRSRIAILGIERYALPK